MSAANGANLSAEDFQRLQDSLLDLKTKNYSLEDQCRKQKSALGEAQAKLGVLEQELGRAQRTIQKSKKASEVQAVTQEKDVLKRKLQSQEEEFRLQNQTLLTELSNLVTSNEKLEREIQTLKQHHDVSGGGGGGTNELSEKVEPVAPAATAATAAAAAAATATATAAEEKLQRTKSELLVASEKIAQLQRENAQLHAEQRPPIRDSSPEKVDLGGALQVSFSKTSRMDDHGEELSRQVAHLQAENTSAKDEVDRARSSVEKSKEEVRKLSEELKAKSDTFDMMQRQKNHQIDKLNEKISELGQTETTRSEALAKENSRLQAQLKSGFDAFNEFKARKAEETEGLHRKMGEMEEKLGQFPPERAAELESRLSASLEQLSSLRAEKEVLAGEGEVLRKAKRAAEAEAEEARTQREDAVKTSEKRKSLLDEMAITVTSKSDEISKLQRELDQIKEDSSSEAERLQDQLSHLETRNSEVEKSEAELRKAKEELQEKVAAAQEELSMQVQRHSRALKESEESHKDMLNVLESEKKLQLRDLNMQLEIANAQRSEFEDSCRSLREEVQDLQEERRIAERKSQQANKDLRRQLQQEKHRNDRLQEKMREVSFSAEVVHHHHGSPPQTADDSDRHSISSWSMMSGQNEVGGANNSSASSSHHHHHQQQHRNKASTPIPASNNSSASSPHNAESLPRDSPLPLRSPPDSGMGALLEKISSLQEDRLVMEEKIHMLENSAAAMAEELLRKTTLINYYCMEGGRSVSVPSTPTGSVGGGFGGASPAAEKAQLTMKKMVNLLVHPDQETRKEMQRMQNMLEETLTKNMHLQTDLESLSQEVVRLSKVAVTAKAASAATAGEE